MAAPLILGFGGLVRGQSNQKASRQPKFTELTEQDNARLEQQRAVVAAAAKQQYGTTALTRTQRDLPILQNLINDRVFKKSQTYELQSLGIAFGDVLASEFPLRWVMVTDEFGTDPTLRFEGTAIQINTLTMISKRVEKGEPVNLKWLVDKTREQLAINQKEPSSKVEKITGRIVAYFSELACLNGNGYWSMLIRVQDQAGERAPRFVQVQFSLPCAEHPEWLDHKPSVQTFRLKRQRDYDSVLKEFYDCPTRAGNCPQIPLWHPVPGTEDEKLPFGQRVPIYRSIDLPLAPVV